MLDDRAHRAKARQADDLRDRRKRQTEKITRRRTAKPSAKIDASENAPREKSSRSCFHECPCLLQPAGRRSALSKPHESRHSVSRCERQGSRTGDARLPTRRRSRVSVDRRTCSGPVQGSSNLEMKHVFSNFTASEIENRRDFVHAHVHV